MSGDDGLADWVAEALEPMGMVTRRAMMGGRTLYLDGTIFAIVAYGELWFKADAESDARWDAIGAGRFTIGEAGGKQMTMNYRRAPSEVYDDAEAMRDWAEVALGAGRRRVKPRPKRKA